MRIEDFGFGKSKQKGFQKVCSHQRPLVTKANITFFKRQNSAFVDFCSSNPLGSIKSNLSEFVFLDTPTL